MCLEYFSAPDLSFPFRHFLHLVCIYKGMVASNRFMLTIGPLKAPKLKKEQHQSYPVAGLIASTSRVGLRDGNC